jgi:hypothetical protein
MFVHLVFRLMGRIVIDVSTNLQEFAFMPIHPRLLIWGPECTLGLTLHVLGK